MTHSLNRLIACAALGLLLASPAMAGDDQCRLNSMPGGPPANEGGSCTTAGNDIGICNLGFCVSTGVDAPEMPAILAPFFLLAAGKVAHSARKRSLKKKQAKAAEAGKETLPL